MVKPFNNSEVTVQSWYVAALSGEVRKRQAISRELTNRRIALFRGEDGWVSALDARCPHLGADLGQGKVIGNHLRCGFHHWTFSGAGECVAIPTMTSIPPFARTFAYPTKEKYGAVWFFNGPVALFPIPSFSEWREDELVSLPLKPQILRCHPHLVACNGLDIQHFRTVHELEFLDEPVAEKPDDFRVRLRLKIRLGRRNWFERSLGILAGESLTATFTTWGGNLATIEGRAGPLPLLVLFTHRPLAGRRTFSQTFLFAPRHKGWKAPLWRNLILTLCLKLVMGYILVKDRRLLDTLEFRPNLVRSDAALAAFIGQVNRMPVFDPGAYLNIAADTLRGL